jgi:hypothetical protein
MARSYSRKDWPNRVLFDTGANAQRGDDIKVLRRHTHARLEARDIERVVGPNDGRYRRELHTAAKSCAHFLGVPEAWTESESGLLVREQRVIIYPETRTSSMLEAARSRMENLLDVRKEAERKERARRKTGALSEGERVKARKVAVAAFSLAHRHKGVVHYTQGGSRWQGISQRRRAANGRFPTYADCSSLATWALWNGLTNVRGLSYPDVVNGLGWRAGFTGTMLSHGERVSSRMPGDLVIYGRGYPGGHVAMVATNTNYVYSHGSESGPHYCPWNYRGDILAVRRYIR